MAIWAGWSHEGPRGTVTIDPETRDIVQDMRVNEVYAEDGRLKMRTIDVIPQVKDPCKEQKVGRCAECYGALARGLETPDAAVDRRSIAGAARNIVELTGRNAR